MMSSDTAMYDKATNVEICFVWSTQRSKEVSVCHVAGKTDRKQIEQILGIIWLATSNQAEMHVMKCGFVRI